MYYNNSSSVCVSDRIRHAHWSNYSPLPMEVHYVFAIVGLIMSFISFIGNGAVLLLFARFRSLRSLSNMFVLNLTVADFFLCLGNSPMFIASSFHGDWLFGNIGCHLYALIGSTASFVSINTLTAIAIDRCRVIVRNRPLHYQVSRRHVLLTIAVIWLYSLGWAVAPILGFGRYILEGSDTSCSFDFLTRTLNNRVYVMAIFTTNFLFPVTIIACSYLIILLTVSGRNHYFIEASSTFNDINAPLRPRFCNRRMDNEMKVSRISVIVILVFCSSWTPYASIAVIGVYGEVSKVTPLSSAIACFCAKLSTIINPLVYALLHPKFKKKLKYHLFSICTRSNSGSENFENITLHQSIRSYSMNSRTRSIRRL